MKRFIVLMLTLAAIPSPWAKEPTKETRRSTQLRRYLVVDSGGDVYQDTCRRKLEKTSTIQICLTGNGQYDLTLIEDEFSKTDWFKNKPFVANQIDTVSFVCKDLVGVKPQIARIALPLFYESRNNKRARIELPCDWNRDQVAAQMLTVTSLLESMQSDPERFIDAIDQVKSACAGAEKKSDSCKTIRAIAMKVISLEGRDEKFPALTIGGVQIVAGLTSKPPTVVARPGKSFADSDAFKHGKPELFDRISTRYKDFEESAKIARDLSTVLPDCGVSFAEKVEQGDMNPFSKDVSTVFTETRKIDWAKCKIQLAAQKALLARDGYTTDEFGIIMKDGKVVEYGSEGVKKPGYKKAIALSQREMEAISALAKDLIDQKKVQGDIATWRRSLIASGAANMIHCAKSLSMGMMGGKPNCGDDDPAQCQARVQLIVQQAKEAVLRQVPNGCGKVVDAEVTTPGVVLFTFIETENPYKNFGGTGGMGEFPLQKESESEAGN